jgi:HD-GYP domain-containing protein (c-di-GMP phosphodiesterase class II)
MRIRTKIVTIIALTIILTVGTTTAIVIRLQNEKIIAASLKSKDISGHLLAGLSLEKTLVVSALLTVLLVSTILSFLLSRLIMGPLDNLLAAIRGVEKGDWQATATVQGNDELGVIGTSFNRMIREIKNLYDKDIEIERQLSKLGVEREQGNRLEKLNSQLEFQIRELETANRAITCLSSEVKRKNIELESAVERLKKINDVGWILTSIIEPQELMKLIIHTTADLVGAEKVTLHLSASGKEPETIRYFKGREIERLGDFSSALTHEYPDILIHGTQVLSTSESADNGEGAIPKTSRIGVPLTLRGQIIGAMFIENGEDSRVFTRDDLELLTTFSNHAVVAMENAWLYDSLKKSYFSTIQSLVNALEASDRFTKGHSERVRLLSVELGKDMGLDFKDLELLEQAAILHDIGKIGIDNFILQKQGRLTTKEYSLVKTHPLIGDEILGPIETLDGVRKTIIQHHERHDGKGYPYGLRGDEISLKSKILSVVDTFDAMMTDRPYRKAITIDRVKEELRAHAGTQFDPHVVEGFVALLSARENELLSAAGYDALYSSL